MCSHFTHASLELLKSSSFFLLPEADLLYTTFSEAGSAHAIEISKAAFKPMPHCLTQMYVKVGESCFFILAPWVNRFEQPQGLFEMRCSGVSA